MRTGILVSGFVSLALLAACSSGGSSSDDDDNAGGGLASIVGLWDDTFVDANEGEDVFYFRIDSDGVITDIDYLGDEFDAGPNCYLIDVAGTLTALGGGEYEFRAAGDDSVSTYTMIRRGDQLAVTSIDLFDDDNDGLTTDAITTLYDAVTGVDPVLEPCI